MKLHSFTAPALKLRHSVLKNEICKHHRFSRNYIAISEVISESFELLIALCKSEDKFACCKQIALLQLFSAFGIVEMKMLWRN